MKVVSSTLMCQSGYATTESVREQTKDASGQTATRLRILQGTYILAQVHLHFRSSYADASRNQHRNATALHYDITGIVRGILAKRGLKKTSCRCRHHGTRNANHAAVLRESSGIRHCTASPNRPLRPRKTPAVTIAITARCTGI